MSRGKSISVKIATTKVIKALEARLAELEKNYASQQANEAKYEKAQEKYNKEIITYAVANIKKAKNFRTNYRQWQETLNIDFDLTVAGSELPQAPERDYEQIATHVYRDEKQEMENAIRILKMTDEEVVNASTYNAIARYL
jgi:hypothetical protein